VLECLRIHNLIKSFGGITAVNGVSFAVGNREIKGLIGPNGAGKTTCLNLISGVLKPSAGNIYYMDRTITGMPAHRIASNGIARTFQNVLLFDQLTVIENILTGCYMHAQVGLVGCLLHLPSVRRAEKRTYREAMEFAALMGLESEANRLASELPLAKQRALEIARALAVKPQLLLLDEPGAGMTPEELSELGKIIAAVKKEREIAILLVDHNMPLVMSLCDDIVVMNFGEVIDEGPPGYIQQSQTVIEAYLGKTEDADVAG
jgi:branched-chain amino acid transport system ATP-binding protein